MFWRIGVSNAECVGASLDLLKCTELNSGVNGKYIAAGLVSQCLVQTGCSEHDATAACVNTKYQKCKDKKNEAGYSIKNGVVTRCAAGKKMAHK